MAIGVSTSCFYPLETECALERLGQSGIKTAEIFINATSELEEPILGELRRIQEQYGIQVSALHPFMSFGEEYLLFSEYERRYCDTLELYKRYFEAANQFGAKYIVIHGAKATPHANPERYIERFARLAETGKSAGLCVAQENVVQYLSQSPEFLLRMRAQLGELFRMVLDTKQARRAGIPLSEFIGPLHAQIVHVHISDYAAGAACLPPGEGELDFSAFFRGLKGLGYRGDYIIELYRCNFQEDEQLLLAKEGLEKIYNIL